MSAKAVVLYHGSAVSGLKTLTPQRRSVRDPLEGPVVFASPDKAIASMFMVSVRQHSGRFNAIPYFVAVRGEFLERDTGGSIYEVTTEGFNFNSALGLGDLEWTMQNSVPVVSEEHYASALACMLEQGVQVYLVSQDTFHAIDKAPDQGLSILQTLESENKLQNKNFRSFPNA